MPTEAIEEPLILPWDAMGAVTKHEHLRKSTYFLESAGYLDPKLMHHRTGPGFAVEREREEIKKGMQEFIRDAIADPKRAKSAILTFVTAQQERIDRKETGPEHL